MRRFISILYLVVLLPVAASWAQLQPPNQAGVTFAQVHLIVKDLEASKKLWFTMGGIPAKIDGTDVVKFPGVLIFLTAGLPSSGSRGTVVDHIGFIAADVRGLAAKWNAAGLKTEITKPPMEDVLGVVYTPDNVRVEIQEDKALTLPLTSRHIHFRIQRDSGNAEPRAAARAMQAWYAKISRGVTAKSIDGGPAVDVPGERLFFAENPEATLPSKGTAVDHIGFEVKNLEAYCKKLETDGMKFDKPYSKTRHKGFASAELIDPWGTSIELTEGLSRLR